MRSIVKSFFRPHLMILTLAVVAQGVLFAAARPDTVIPSDSNFKAHPEWNEGF